MSQLNRWAIYVLLIVFLLASPIIAILLYLPAGPGETWSHIQNNLLLNITFNTFALMLGVGVLSLVFGISTAWIVSTCHFPGRKFFEWALILPLAVPSYIIAYTYAGIFDYTGPLQKLMAWLGISIEGQLFDVMNLRGLIFILAFVLYPYVYVVVRTAFVSQARNLLEASRMLGKGAWHSFFRVALPISRPAWVGGVSLALMEVLNDYGAAKYFGVSTFTTGIFRSWFSMGDVQSAIYLSAILVTVVFIIIALERRQRGAAKYHALGANSSKPIARYRLSGWKKGIAFTICLIPFLFGFFIPLLQLISWSVQTAHKVVNLSFLTLVFNSFYLAALAAILAVFVATILLYSVRLNPKVWIRSVAKLAVLGYSIPGAVIAVGIMTPVLGLDKQLADFIYGLTGVDPGLLFTGTIAVLLFAYIVRFLAVGYNPIEAGFKQTASNYDEASRILGTSPLKTLLKINLPLVKTAILSGALLVFVDVLKELPLTLIMRPFNFDTLATKAFELASDEMVPESASAALIIIATGIIPIFVLSNLISGRKINGRTANQ
ncbi:MAG: iron ABC transporter permease [Cyclobacteriaceae bacterium]|nr:iron ABC transporter permease [Cyclobacteriaceae bacterium]